MKIQSLIFLFGIIFAINATAQNSQLKGLGLITPQKNCVSCGWGIFTPREGLNLYDGPQGNKVALLTKQVDGIEFDNNGYSLYIIKDTLESDEPKRVRPEITSVGVEQDYLTYFEIVDDYLRIIIDKNSFWIKSSSLSNKKFRAINWNEFYTQFSFLEIFSENELYIKESPNADSKNIKRIQGDLFEITLTSRREGDWTKVIVKKYKIGVCEEAHEASLEYEVEGWIKVVDHSGNPLLNFYGSC